PKIAVAEDCLELAVRRSRGAGLTSARDAALLRRIGGAGAALPFVLSALLAFCFSALLALSLCVCLFAVGLPLRRFLAVVLFGLLDEGRLAGREVETVLLPVMLVFKRLAFVFPRDEYRAHLDRAGNLLAHALVLVETRHRFEAILSINR